MDAKKLGTSVLCVQVMALVFSLILAEAQSEFPDQEALYSTSVALFMRGFVFTAGLWDDEKKAFYPDGKPNGDGTFILKGVSRCGSGFVAKSDGSIVTNYHVAQRASEGSAVFGTNAKYTINHIIVYNRTKDLAVLKINSPTPFPTVTHGNSDNVKILDKVLAIGNSKCEGLSYTSGEINQIITDQKTLKPYKFKHNAVIERGASGGPLYRGKEVVGINHASLNIS
jgi:S1-C subfamily serine protease